jgi:hypothetical protein
MNDIISIKSNLPTDYRPERHGVNIAALEYGIKEAKRIRDWPALAEAVDQKIEEQTKFVGWWGATVRPAGNPQLLPVGNNWVSVEEAEDLTGMSPPRTSKLKSALARGDKYRDKLLGKAFVAAHLDDAHVRGTDGTGDNECTPRKNISRWRARC